MRRKNRHDIRVSILQITGWWLNKKWTLHPPISRSNASGSWWYATYRTTNGGWVPIIVQAVQFAFILESKPRVIRHKVFYKQEVPSVQKVFKVSRIRCSPHFHHHRHHCHQRPSSEVIMTCQTPTNLQPSIRIWMRCQTLMNRKAMMQPATKDISHLPNIRWIL